MSSLPSDDTVSECDTRKLEDFLVRFREHPRYFNMRYQELEGLARSLSGLATDLLYCDGKLPTASSNSITERIRLPNKEAACKLCERSVLVSGVFEIWGSGVTFDEAIDAMLLSFADPDVRVKRKMLTAAPNSLMIHVDTHGISCNADDKMAKVAKLTSLMPWDVRIDLKTPDVVLWVIEEYNAEKQHPSSFQAFVALQLCCSPKASKGPSMCPSFSPYDLANRPILGPTTENELCFIMANCAETVPGTLALDPFCGTGGILLALSHFGAHVFGAEADPHVVKGLHRTYIKNEAATLAVMKRREEQGLITGTNPVEGRHCLQDWAHPGAVPLTALDLHATYTGIVTKIARKVKVYIDIGAVKDGYVRIPADAHKDFFVGMKLMGLRVLVCNPAEELLVLQLCEASPSSASEQRAELVDGSGYMLPKNSMHLLCDAGNLKTNEQTRQRATPGAHTAAPRDIFVNFEHYGLRPPEIIICDITTNGWRSKLNQGFFDCIVCDPPYGIREGIVDFAAEFAKSTELNSDAFASSHEFIPPTKGHAGNDRMLQILFQLAAEILRDGGLLVFLLTVDLGELAEVPSGVKLRARDRRLLDECRYKDFVPGHNAFNIEHPGSLQLVVDRLGRLLIKMRRKPRS